MSDMRYSQACTVETLLNLQSMRSAVGPSLCMGEQLRWARQLQTLPRAVVLHIRRFVLRVLPGNFDAATAGQSSF